MKKFTTLIIIIVALGGAIFLGYSALNNNSPSTGSAAAPKSTILPYGTGLDFQPLSNFNSTNRFFPYPQVTPQEIGTANSSLVP